MLEFEQGTNMDSASIEISNRLDQVKAKFDDGVGSPTMMRISPDMMPVMVASVDAGGKSVEEVTKLVNDTVLPALQRVDGVGSVTASGLVEQQLKITLDQGKIDELNDRVLQAVDAQLYDAKNGAGRRPGQAGRGQAAAGVRPGGRGFPADRRQRSGGFRCGPIERPAGGGHHFVLSKGRASRRSGPPMPAG